MSQDAEADVIVPIRFWAQPLFSRPQYSIFPAWPPFVQYCCHTPTLQSDRRKGKAPLNHMCLWYTYMYTVCTPITNKNCLGFPHATASNSPGPQCAKRLYQTISDSSITPSLHLIVLQLHSAVMGAQRAVLLHHRAASSSTAHQGQGPPHQLRGEPAAQQSPRSLPGPSCPKQCMS